MKKIFFCLAFLGAFSAFATPAPNFTVTTSDNQNLQLYSSFVQQGKVLVIEAFFTTCPPCNTHAPLMQNLYTQMLAAHPGKVEFLLLSTLSSDTNVKVAQYKSSKGLTMPAVGANGGSQTALQPYMNNQFGPFEGTPTFIVIAPNTGEVHFDIRGATASATMTLLSQKINELLPPPTCPVQDFFGENIPGVVMQMKGVGLDTTFQVSGTYGLAGFPAVNQQSYTLRPQKTDEPLSGITTYDLVIISKHILGIEAMTCDWQRLAADVDCSGSITTFDIVTARKLILGILQELPCGSWRFSPDSAVVGFPNCAAFQGVKIGDVYGPLCDQFAPDPDDRTPVQFQIEDRKMEAGERLHLPVKMPAPNPCAGFQMQLRFNPKKLKINEIYSPSLSDFDESNFHIMHHSEEDAFLLVSWTNPYGQQLAPDATWLEIDATPAVPGALSDVLDLSAERLSPQFYDPSGHIHALELQWQAPADPRPLIQPNPATELFYLTTTLSAPLPVTVEVRDMYGRPVRSFAAEGQPGYNRWTFQVGQIPRGIYWVSMNAQAVGKLVVQ